MDTNRHMHMLGPVDTAFWHLDSDKTPMNIGSLMLFEGRIAFNDLIAYVDSHLHLAPLYQQRVVNAAYNMSEPTWVFDDDFHIEYHVRQVSLSAPGDDEQLYETAGNLISGRLDPAKPLWELYMIDGLADNRTAVLTKVHHCMVDGISAIELMTLLLGLDDDKPSIQEKPLYNPPATPSNATLLGDSLQRGFAHRANILKHVGTDAFKVMTGLLDRTQRKKTLTGLVSALHDNLTPIHKLPINGENTGDFHFASVDFPLENIKRIRRARQASVNDVMLTILGTAVERFTEEQGNPNNQGFVRMICPVDMRRSEAASHDGNRISTISVEVPFFVDDPLDRLTEVSRYSHVMKESQLATMLDGILSLPSLAHASLQPLIWRVAPTIFAALGHMWCTNVPGPSIPLYLLGHRMLKVAGFFPLNPTMGLASVIVSYNGTITISLVADRSIIPDITTLKNHLQDAYIELCNAIDIKPDLNVETPTSATNTEQTPAAVQSVVTPPTASQNGTATTAQTEITTKTESKPRLMSEGWAKALQATLNTSEAYHDASTRWTAGALALVMKAAPQQGYPSDTAVLLDLHRGRCRMGHSISVEQAYAEATFVLEGSYQTWMTVLEGRAQPLQMIVRRQLKLKQGALHRLLPFTKSAQELVNCAKQIT